MSKPNWTRLALRNRDQRGVLNAVGNREHWTMDEFHQASDDRMFEIVWLDEDQQTRISYIQDDILGLDLFFAIGPKHADVAAKLQAKADIITCEEALEFARKASNTEERVQAAYIIAATSGCVFDEQAFAILESLAGTDDAPARHATAIAMGYVGWEECVPLLKKLADDKDPKVSASAKGTLSHWPIYG